MMLDDERLNWAEAEGIENRMTYKGDRKENEWDLVADLCEVIWKIRKEEESRLTFSFIRRNMRWIVVLQAR